MTEKKIISLKKKDSAAEASSTVTHTTKVVRNIPTAKVFPESKRQAGTTTAVVKPVPKAITTAAQTLSAKQLTHQPNHRKNASEFEDEDELLADSPSASPTHHGGAYSAASSNSAAAPKSALGAGQPTTRFTNRRVVFKSSDSSAAAAVHKLDRKPSADAAAAASSRTATTSKGVFDRLDRKVVHMSEAKRKIQRIVIQNTE